MKNNRIILLWWHSK